MRRVRRCALVGALVGGLLIAGYVWLALWADNRNQQFYMRAETRNWQG